MICDGRLQNRVGVALHQQLHFFRFMGAFLVVCVAVEAAQFKGDQRVGQRFDFGGRGFGFGIRFLVSIWVSSLEGKSSRARRLAEASST